MKKLLVLLICLATIFSLIGCGGQTEDTTADGASKVIDLGGGLGKITLEGDAYGTYRIIDTPEEFVFEGTQTTAYEDQNSDTPYIVVYRFSKNDNTLEAIAQEEAGLYAEDYYVLTDQNLVAGKSGAYICCSYQTDTEFYYVDMEIYEDGDDFVEVSFFGKTEELQIGDTDVYAWVPTGYTDNLTQDDIDYGTIFWGEYSKDYYFPSMWIGKWDDSYEYLEWLWDNEYPDDLPISEEEYADMLENWDEDSMFEYYEKMGAEIVFSSTEENESYPYDGEYTVLTGIADANDIWFKISDDWYSAWFFSELDPVPAYSGVFLKSLHTRN